MSSWIFQHFLNPSYFWPGLMLLAAPVIIHLINRMRYRRVRFAAMEFLLASQKRNRRRVLLEQLLLLLLRIALVLLVVALVARLIVDPQQLSLFQGAKSHHVIILDDTASMRDRIGEMSAFDTAKEVVRRIVAEGARRPGSQLLSLVLMSEPDKTVGGLSERTVDQTLMAEVGERLETLNCTHQRVDPALALEAAQRRLMNDRSSVRHVHVISDFRQVDWIDNKGAVGLLQALARAKTGVNLVRCVASGHENLGITDLGGAVEVAAAGVPVSLSATVRNWGTRQATSVRGSVFIDGVRLPRTIDFQTIEPGQQTTRNFDVVFETPQPHALRMTIGEDALEADNERTLGVDVPVDNPVLIVDGSPAAEQAQYVADALAADRSVTGFAPEIRSPEEFRRTDLDRYHLIYLINVGEMAADTVAALDRYVRDGGGLIWYLGDAVRPAFYNEKLFSAEGGLFPARLGLAPVEVPHEGETRAEPDISMTNYPPFGLFHASEVPVLDLIFVNLYYPLAAAEPTRPNIESDARVVATVRGAPLMIEHRLGEGHIFTCLTAAGPLQSPSGPVWTNWANGPAGFSFVILQLELAKRLIRSNRAFPQLPAGTPLEIQFNQALYQPDVEITTPSDQITRIQAAPANTDDGDPSAAPQLEAVFRQTDQPGIYSVLLIGQDQHPQRRLFALNVPPEEGSLQVAADAALLRELGPDAPVQIQPAGSFEWIRSESPGSEVRWLLLVMLALVSIGEQLLASRLSYQTGS